VIGRVNPVVCPDASLVYAQVLTPGFRIILFSENMQLEYHADQQGEVIFRDHPHAAARCDPLTPG